MISNILTTLLGIESVGELTDNLNWPGVLVLLSSGVGAMLYVAKQMMNYQREFTSFYIEENNKLRDRMATKDTENEAMDDRLMAARRELLKHEEEAGRRMREMELTILQHEHRIEAQSRKIESLEAKRAEDAVIIAELRSRL